MHFPEAQSRNGQSSVPHQTVIHNRASSTIGVHVFHQTDALQHSLHCKEFCFASTKCLGGRAAQHKKAPAGRFGQDLFAHPVQRRAPGHIGRAMMQKH
jgi:hypothetical protein